MRCAPPTVTRALTDGHAGLAWVWVPSDDHGLHAVLSVGLQVTQGHQVLLAVADGSGL